MPRPGVAETGVEIGAPSAEVGREQLPAPQTRTGRMMHGNPYTLNEPILSEGDARLNLAPGTDQFALDDEEKEHYGISELYDHCWIRNPRMWTSKENRDRARQFMKDNPGAYVVTNPEDGDFVVDGDLILAATPKVYRERREALQEVATREYIEGIASERPHGVDGRQIDAWDSKSDSDLRRMARQDRQENQNSSMIGPTSGASWLQWMEIKGREAVEAEQAQWRNRGKTLTGAASKLQEEMMAAARNAAGERNEARGSGGRFVSGSIPKNVASKNGGWTPPPTRR